MYLTHGILINDAGELGTCYNATLGNETEPRPKSTFKGLTRAAVAERCNVTVAQVERIETTAVGGVPLETIYEYLYRLGLDLHLVVSDNDTSVLVGDDENLPAALEHLSGSGESPSEQERSRLQARAIGMAHLYQVLVEHASANPNGFASFLTAQLGDTPCPEYRFQGSLGFGGKLVWDQARGFRVTCYSEDLTPERQEVIDNVHRILESMGMSRPPLR